MKRLFFPLLLLFAACAAFTACEETDAPDDPQYANWAERNDAYFRTVLAEAKTAIAEARATYGDDWADHCDWRVYRTYANDSTTVGAATDTVAVRIMQRGTGSGYPLYTDTVRINVMMRLIPNALADTEEARTKGELISYTGVSKDSVDVFGTDFSTPNKSAVSNNVEGLTTALMRMRIGDLWRVYIPQQLANGANSTEVIPAYSMLIYDVQLKAFYRKGTVVPSWN